LVVADKQWSDATDRDYRIKGRHSRAYYKQADSWLNNGVAAARLQGQNPAEAALRQVAAVQARESMLAVASETEA
jgi:Tfp pilus assembly protein PilF